MKNAPVLCVLCLFNLLLVRPATVSAHDILLAQMESESRHVFRGGVSGSQPPPRDEAGATRPQSGESAMSFPLRPLQIHLEQENLTLEQKRVLQSAIGTSPLLRQSASQSGADILLRAQPTEKQTVSQHLRIRLERPSKASSGGGQDFFLPKDAAALRTTLEGHMRLRTVLAAKGNMPWPDIACGARAHSPAKDAEPGDIRHDGKNWRPTHTLAFSQNMPAESIKHPALLTFSFSNKSNAGYFIYVLNCTDEGQILPVFPPLGAANMPNKIAAGKDLAPANFLELTTPVEYLRIVASKKPLDIRALAQESFASGRPQPGAGRGKPADSSEWAVIAVELTDK